MSAFTQDLILTIVDKLIIGGLILLGGYVLNRALERYKAKDAFTREIARKRVDEMGEVWSALYEYDFLIGDMEDVIGRVKLMQGGRLEQDLGYSQEALEKKGQLLASESEKRKGEILRELEKSRYWVGEETYTQYQRYFRAQRERLEYFFRFLKEDDDKQSAEMWEKHELAVDAAKKARRDVLKVVDELSW
jgi:hypothetical protein